MFDFQAWARAYLRPVFGDHAEISFTGSCEATVAWAVTYESGEMRRYEAVLRLDETLYQHLQQADEDERATRGLAINAWLLREGIAPGHVPQSASRLVVIGKGAAGL
ncbi:hypothetical protein V8Z80_02540 [Orrella sp. JC864]|uniref:hypothetical protein n=1 Tax=Orrella sp. JC864 TaxID=3120298 RepID=UPI00300B99C9